jgi:hypothetical protein
MIRRDSSNDFEAYASLATAAAGVTKLSFRVRCETAGTLVVKKAAGGTNVAVMFKAGETKEIAITGIVEAGSSGCVPIEVYR